MLNTIVHSDEITLWWTKDEFDRADNYQLFLNGSLAFTKDKTHATFSNLLPNTPYQVCVKGYKNGVEHG